jgi:hypothetical protein
MSIKVSRKPTDSLAEFQLMFIGSIGYRFIDLASPVNLLDPSCPSQSQFSQDKATKRRIGLEGEVEDVGGCSYRCVTW